MAKILTTFLIKDKLLNELINKFPEDTFYNKPSMNDALDFLPEAEILLTYGEDLTASLIEKAVNLKWIMVTSAGMEKMPFESIKQKGIFVTNARGIHKSPMAEYTIGMMLQVYRNAKTLIDHEQQGKWDRKVNMAELNEKTLLIIGAGAIGQEIARIAKAFRMTTLGINSTGESVEFFDEIKNLREIDYFLHRADFIVNVLPSTKETIHILKLSHFEKMNREAVFINIGRGSVVDESVLLEVLQKQLVSHLVLDVFQVEPLPSHHIFWKHDKVTVTPHLSGISKKYIPRSLEIFKHNLKVYKGYEKEYINSIDLDKGY